MLENLPDNLPDEITGYVWSLRHVCGAVDCSKRLSRKFVVYFVVKVQILVRAAVGRFHAPIPEAEAWRSMGTLRLTLAFVTQYS